MSNLSETVVAAVTQHMNSDHLEDNLVIARAFGAPEAQHSVMVGVSEHSGVWRVEENGVARELTVPWPGGEIAERPEIRREVVALYREACARLGIPPREESAPTSGVSGSADPQPDAETKPFSVALREGSWSDHSESEGATFMEDIIRGIGTRDDYVALAAQHYFMYEALEEAAAALANHPDFAGFHPAELTRMPALIADLEFLLGAQWREQIAAVPATAAYAARIRELAAEGWVPGVVAHHYTRYLGDLSGGQMIARRVAKQHGFAGEGVAFYDFTALESIPVFKEQYRAALDRLGAGLSDADRERMLDEVRAAYGFNTAVFIELGAAKRA